MERWTIPPTRSRCRVEARTKELGKDRGDTIRPRRVFVYGTVLTNTVSK